MADDVRTGRSRQRSFIGKVALAGIAISGAAWIALLIGAEGDVDGSDPSALASLLWLAFVIGAGIALVFGASALIRGHVRSAPADSAAGRVAIVWFVLAVLVVAFVAGWR